MQAVVKYEKGPGNVALLDVPAPMPAPNQVLLEVLCCGICGTDLHVYHDTFRNYPPVILGHEFVGTVVERGSAVADVPLGSQHAVLGAIAVQCGQCRYCRSGEFMFCPNRRGMGHGVNGAFARYAVARPDQLFAVPESVPTEQVAIIASFGSTEKSDSRQVTAERELKMISASRTRSCFSSTLEGRSR